MKRFIVDACVAVKWIFDEPFRLEALRFLQTKAELIAPDLFQQECMNVISKKIRFGDLKQEDGVEYYHSIIQSSTIKFVPANSYLYKALALSVQLNHSVYDCIYLAAAEDLQAVMVTADRKFYDKVAGSLYHHNIQWIETPPKIEM